MFDIDRLSTLLTLSERLQGHPALGTMKILVDAEINQMRADVEKEVRASAKTPSPPPNTGPKSIPAVTYTSDDPNPAAVRNIIGGVPGPAEPAPTIDRRS